MLAQQFGGAGDLELTEEWPGPTEAEATADAPPTPLGVARPFRAVIAPFFRTFARSPT